MRGTIPLPPVCLHGMVLGEAQGQVYLSLYLYLTMNLDNVIFFWT